jgi:hypothetical protein
MEIQKKTEGESLLNEIRFLNSLKYFSASDYFSTKMIIINSTRVDLVKGDILYTEGSPCK